MHLLGEGGWRGCWAAGLAGRLRTAAYSAAVSPRIIGQLLRQKEDSHSAGTLATSKSTCLPSAGVAAQDAHVVSKHAHAPAREERLRLIWRPWSWLR